ncbi:MAG: beta-glucosidase [Bacteroidia bacterium]
MKYQFYLILLAAFLNFQCKNQADSAESKAKSLLSKMTLEEKAGQMTQLSIEMISKGGIYQLEEPHALDSAKLEHIINKMGVGSILNVGGHTYTQEHWLEIQSAIKHYNAKTRLKIPVMYGIDAIHGANYTLGASLYPQQIGLAASFNKDLVAKMGTLVANDVKASGIHWNFSPDLDVARNPRWPRFWETFGEDPYVVSEMGKLMVKGYQTHVAACLKHYVGYGDPKSGNDRTPAYIPERQLREIFLPPFQQAIEAGAKTIMINSGEVNGEPVHASSFLLKTILRDELKFKGFTVTDWEDIKNLVERHRVAGTYKEAIALAINAGIDMAMVPLDTLFTSYLIENVKEGKIKKERIDEAVLRILTVKYELGMFEEEQVNLLAIGNESSKNLSYELAAQSITLLKNTNEALPLKADEKVLVTGPNADYINALNGGWTHTWQGRDTIWNDASLTAYEGICESLGKAQVKLLKGNTYDSRLSEIDLLKAAQGIETIILCLGENTYTEKMGDIDDLELEAAQQELIGIYKKAGKKVIVVLLQGRPRTFYQMVEKCDAIISAYLPGNFGGKALGDILTGKVNPSGKLPFSYPKYAGHFTTYDCKLTETINNKFQINGSAPLYPFGHGLSYTQFSYTDLQIKNRILQENDSIEISVKIGNSGNRNGMETVLVYSSDPVASITPSIKRLRAFEKIDLKVNEKKELLFKLPAKNLSFVGLNNQFILEPGKYYIELAGLRDSIEIK